MKSLKRSAIIFTISVAGLLSIRAAEKRDITFSGPHYSLESLAWQSTPEPAGRQVDESLLQDARQQSTMREYIFTEVSRCTRMNPTH